MKNLISVIAVLALCIVLACPAFAATNTFVPSISYKDGPELIEAEQNGEDVGDCLIVTSIPQAREKTTDIYQEDRDLLLEVYKELNEGSMKLPLEDDYVIRELVDVSYQKTTCVEDPHHHDKWLEEEGNTVTVVFDLGIPKNTDVIVLVFIDGEWTPIESVENNGDGTLTCVFEDICPVAFCVKDRSIPLLPQTGDVMGRSLWIWIAVMAGSAGALVVLVFLRRRKKR